MRHILLTVHGITNQQHKKRRIESLRFVVNDIEPEILARDALLLEIINTVDVEKEEDIKFLWAVWYNIDLSIEHYQRLITMMER